MNHHAAALGFADLERDEWTQWDNAYVQHLYSIIFGNPMVRAVTDRRIDAGTLNGIQFILSGKWKFMEELLPDIETSWIQWKSDAERSIWATGLLATVSAKDKQNERVVPQVLDLSKYDVFWRHKHGTLVEYRFALVQTGIGAERKFLSNVDYHQFCPMLGSMPASIARTLSKKMYEISLLEQFDLRASDYRSQNFLVTREGTFVDKETEQQVQDNEIADAILQTLNSRDIEPIDDPTLSAKGSSIAILSKHVDMLSGSMGEEYKSRLRKKRNHGDAFSDDFHQVRIDQNRVLQQHVPAQSPMDLPQKEDILNQLIHTLFGVPLAMTSGRSSQGQVAMNRNAAMIFMSTIDASNQRLRPIAIRVFKKIYLDAAIEADTIAEEAEKKEQSSPEEQLKSEQTNVDITFPLLQPWPIMERLFELDVLTAEGMADYVATKFSIPRRFIKKTRISKQERIASHRAYRYNKQLLSDGSIHSVQLR